MAQKYHGQDLKDAHALAIGKIVMAWNEYNEMLGETYVEICGRAGKYIRQQVTSVQASTSQNL